MELYKIKADGEILEIEKAPFSDEPREMEEFVLRNEGIFGKLALLNRQIALPDGKRIDIWGLDTLDQRPVIIELKNQVTGIEIIPQILPYYNFVKLNPDTLKFQALSDEKFLKKLERLEIHREKLFKGLEEDPKVILIAPAFKKDLLDVVDHMKFDIELVEISRYRTKESEYQITVHKPQVESPVQTKVRVMEEWSWEKYRQEGISDSKIHIAKALKENIDKILAAEKINLQSVFRKLYIPYQSGRNNVFWLDLTYTSWETGDVVLTFNLDKEPNLKTENIQIKHTKTRWQENYNTWLIFFNEIVDLSPLIPLMKRSYEYMTGTKISDGEDASLKN